ncbi:MAG: hypothetical protein KME28_13965 [Pelatocladus maniniholoensis HA4357-MV3]|uniref:Uncharacterized protein n=1 Tax=Pelatocladus maniniholoensis HA4357-MV3 TaxID=1117104 RepID=A0A9E3LU99_9NOST|nr:hypothetical protein [Pelatocladus maniniholoensis HA4357-MV3]
MGAFTRSHKHNLTTTIINRLMSRLTHRRNDGPPPARRGLSPNQFASTTAAV